MILLHRYGGDRSLLFNLGMKMNEATGCTILWPDLRGHGMTPPVNWTSFGSRESNDVLAALDFPAGLKGDERSQLIGDAIGIYGVEIGAYAALRAAVKDESIQVLVLDSVPRSQNELVEGTVRSYVGVNTKALLCPARLATQAYFLGNTTIRILANSRRLWEIGEVLLLAGDDDGYLRESTKAVASCFPNPSNLETKTDLPLTGFTLPSATGEQGEGYNRPVIDFFVKNLQARLLTGQMPDQGGQTATKANLPFSPINSERIELNSRNLLTSSSGTNARIFVLRCRLCHTI